jgi:uncharacterized membrane protein YgdD (TMEM256/DUF423 family)
MSFHVRCFLVLGGLNAAVAVTLGAAGTHALRAVLAANDPANWFALALQYHQFHALGLILIGIVADRIPASRWLVGAGWLMLVGIALFSGSLYLLSLFGLHAVHAAIPFGGASFILAWLLFIVGALHRSPDRVHLAEMPAEKVDQRAHLR